ncbi:hypothetical protein VTP01DRAFT_9051 [Rhizomucor pusillus]|uniref:uncharacterized protein n=1 Tax=Rhizomucor pusillus TaxID=4840 RepID=UPI00374495AE
MSTSAYKKPPREQLHRRRSSRAAPGEKFDDYILRRKADFEHEHKRISIYTSPLLVISYFAMFTFYEARSAVLYLYRQRYTTLALLISAISVYVSYQFQGPHQDILWQAQRLALWYGYWVLLGVASAFGLGTGLHTFLLFLGPYIAEVTLASYQCQGVEYLTRDTMSYHLQCQAPGNTLGSISLWDIYRQIRWESFAWGAGTALGELPPYFVARAVAISGGKSQELAELEACIEKTPESRSLKERLTFLVYSLMKRLGFFGILLFASIPNPLFDLAGITCGHFLVPFATFFGATFLGKACVKASIQSAFVILAFSKDASNAFLDTLERIAPSVHSVVEHLIQQQTNQLGKGSGEEQKNLFGILWNVFLSIMLCYFVISSVESLGLAYMKREHEREIKRLERQRQTIPSSSSFPSTSANIFSSVSSSSS